jgi:phenylalanine ammonia-lyase
MSAVDQINSQTKTLSLSGEALDLHTLHQIGCRQVDLAVADDGNLVERMRAGCGLVTRATREGWSVYGVTTGFGGMADVPVPHEMSVASQNNLLSFLATGAGDPVDQRHVRTAMALRANVLLQGHSGVRLELVERLLKFINADAIPVVRDLGSIGASGDLVPLASIARAITGQTDHSEVCFAGRTISGPETLAELDLEPIELQPKEGLALVNGTSFSSAIAANCVIEAKKLMALSLSVNAMMMAALNVQQQPFTSLVHKLKPHPGQRWTGQMMLRLLNEGTSTADPKTNGHASASSNGTPHPKTVQDRYSLRCFPQYMGSVVESMARICQTVTTEMNGVSDNPLIDTDHNAFCQSGNFLGQYIALAMDDLRNHIGLMAKHLDVQIATLVTPEFSKGLPPSLQGNPALPYNMGLKGLQITGNSIMPMLSWYGNPIVVHYPTHAEQFNQNINGLSWGSANLAWKSVGLFQKYLATSLIFAVQAIDLRAKDMLGHCDGRKLLGSFTVPLYNRVYEITDRRLGADKPLVFDDSDQWLEQWLMRLSADLEHDTGIGQCLTPIMNSFEETFE